jgi:hypothetical protein
MALGDALRPGDRIYVAARFERQAEARQLAEELVAAGYVVTSRWLTVAGEAVPSNATERAEDDLDDLFGANVYMLLSDDVPGRGGKDFEAGVAWANTKRIVVVGPPAHIFHFLHSVHRLRDVAELRAKYLDKKS